MDFRIDLSVSDGQLSKILDMIEAENERIQIIKELEEEDGK